jgi:HNH endonuclease
LVKRTDGFEVFEFIEESIADYLVPWQETTAVHRFARFVADDMFLQDTNGPYISGYVSDDDFTSQPPRYLPVDCALRAYGLISHEEMFRVPPRDGKWVKEDPCRNIISWQESSKVADACYEYTRELQWYAVYEELAKQIGEEVLHTMFPNQLLLGQINEIISHYVREVGPEFFAEQPEFAGLFEREGVLKRRQPPEWVRKAVFHRDRGHCVICGSDQSGLMDSQSAPHLDHIVPLELGGLNDLSNMQLLCAVCNGRKGDRISTSTLHKRTYKPPRPRSARMWTVG